MFNNLFPLFEPVEKATYLQEGAEGLVYRLGERQCIKISKYPEAPIQKLVREASINDKLYRCGVSVPEPRGMFRLRASSFETLPPNFDVGSRTLLPGFVREFVHGSLYKDLPQHLRDEAERKYNAELNKAFSFGFISLLEDCFHDGLNVLYQVNNNTIERAVLIDFGFWGMR